MIIIGMRLSQCIRR